jgi:hypothetical protein
MPREQLDYAATGDDKPCSLKHTSPAKFNWNNSYRDLGAACRQLHVEFCPLYWDQMTDVSILLEDLSAFIDYYFSGAQHQTANTKVNVKIDTTNTTLERSWDILGLLLVKALNRNVQWIFEPSLREVDLIAPQRR